MTRFVLGQVIQLPVGYTVVPYKQRGSGYFSIIVAGVDELQDHVGLSLFFFTDLLTKGEVIDIRSLLKSTEAKLIDAMSEYIPTIPDIPLFELHEME